MLPDLNLRILQNTEGFYNYNTQLKLWRKKAKLSI